MTPNTARQLEPDHQAWNPDYPAIIRERFVRLSRLRAKPELWQVAKAHYKNNPVDFIEDWCWTTDPRIIDGIQEMPMILFPRQKEFIWWLHEMWQGQENGLAEKSRDMGLTWLCVQFGVWGYIFHNMKAAYGSRKEQLVDRIGDPDGIFEKIRMTARSLPPELLPPGFNVDKHIPHLKMQMPGWAGALTGEAGDEIGRGGRNTMYFVDESAKLAHPRLVDASLSHNTNCRIDVSTVNGVGNPFYVKRHTYPARRIFIFDWRDDPRKDEAWYAKQLEDFDPMIVAQEVDRNYDAAAENVLIPAAWVKACVGLKLPATGPVRASLDVADEGPDSNALCISQGPVVKSIEEWKTGTTTQTARKALRLAKEAGAAELRYDSVGVGAGVKGELGDQKNKGQLGKIVPLGINTGGKVSKGWMIPPTQNQPGKRWKDHVRNLKAEAWWRMRLRCQRTYEHVNKIRESHPDDMLSLPLGCNDLVMELSGPKYEETETGLLKVEPKRAMKNRGLPSPNLADALILAYCPTRPKRKVTF